jgi:hypothetical protein
MFFYDNLIFKVPFVWYNPPVGIPFVAASASSDAENDEESCC